MSTIRPAAVSGTFYPADPGELARLVDGLLEEATGGAGHDPLPPSRAVIAPHAGFVYSGAVAATAFARLGAAAERIRRVVVIGPSHHVPLQGAALPLSEAFSTPFGTVPVDPEAAEALAGHPTVVRDDGPHRREHSLETHLPFLSRVLGEIRVVPLAVGQIAPEVLGGLLEPLWDDPATAFSVSSDLSHFLDHTTARRRDEGTARAIEELRYEELSVEDACGREGIRGLLWLARRRHLAVHCLDLRSSGDTVGPKDRVVGYGAFAVEEGSSPDAP